MHSILKRLCLVVSVFFITQGLLASDDDWEVIEQGSYSIPFGNSQSALFKVDPQLNSKRLKVTYEGTYCDIGIRYIQVGYPGEVLMEKVQVTGPEIELQRAGFNRLRIHNSQNKWKTVTCLETIMVGKIGTYGLDDFEYIGTIKYDSKEQSFRIPVSSAQKISHFWVETPFYCNKLVIKRAGTVTEGYFDAAELINEDKRIYEVAGGFPQRVSSIEMQLRNGAENYCDIAMYVKTERE